MQTIEQLTAEIGMLRQRVAHAEAILANVAEAIVVCRLDGRIIDVNRAATELLDFSTSDLVGKRVWDVVSNVAPEGVWASIGALQSRMTATYQQEYRRKNGERRSIELRASRCATPEDELILLCFRDITDERALEARLRKSEKNLAEGQRLTKTGSWVLDFQTGLTDWSVETCRIFGFPDPPPSPHYSEFRSRVDPAYRDAVDRGLQESFECIESRPLEYWFVLPDGTRKYIETISEPVMDDAGQLKLMGTVMDVTERVKAEEALQRSEQCARAQAEALRQILDELAHESSADRVIEHVLRTITAQLGAVGSNVWLREPSTGLMNFEFAFEGDLFTTKTDSILPGASPTVKIDEVWPLSEVFQTGRPYVIEDIREGSPFSWWSDLAARGIITILIVPMLIGGRVEGVIGIRFADKRVCRPEELELAQSFAHQAMLAMQLRRLAILDRQAAITAERTRMARDLHDTLAQGFTGVIVQLEAAEDAWSQGLIPEASTHVTRARELARGSLHEARLSTRALRHSALMERTLVDAIQDLIRKMTSGTGVAGSLKLGGHPWALGSECEENLLRIAQEVLTNTLRHARAKTFEAHLVFDQPLLRFEFRDDGVGFSLGLEHEGLGLVGIKERVEAMGGTLVIQSGSGRGTVVVVSLGLNRKPTT